MSNYTYVLTLGSKHIQDRLVLIARCLKESPDRIVGILVDHNSNTYNYFDSEVIPKLKNQPKEYINEPNLSPNYLYWVETTEDFDSRNLLPQSFCSGDDLNSLLAMVELIS